MHDRPCDYYLHARREHIYYVAAMLLYMHAYFGGAKTNYISREMVFALSASCARTQITCVMCTSRPRNCWRRVWRSFKITPFWRARTKLIPPMIISRASSKRVANLKTMSIRLYSNRAFCLSMRGCLLYILCVELAHDGRGRDCQVEYICFRVDLKQVILTI